MVEKFLHTGPESMKNIIENPRNLFRTLTGEERRRIEDLGYTIDESKSDIIESVSYDWFVTLKKNNKELVLKGLVDHRFNTGSEPVEIVVEKNNFSKEELKILIEP